MKHGHSVVPATEATLDAFKTNADLRFSGGKTSYSDTLVTAGDNTVITPASGKRIQVFWVHVIPNSNNDSANLVAVKFAGGITMYTSYVISHWEPFTGGVDQAVVVNLQNTERVAVTIHYKEI